MMPATTTHSRPYRVTAIVSTYLAADFMVGRLENLLEQSLHRQGALEIIVVDTGSPEDEMSIVRMFQRQSDHLHYVRTAGRQSVYAAWNLGLRLARGRYLINANTDDRFTPDALERLATVLDEDAEAAAVYGDWYVTHTPNDRLDSQSPKQLMQYPAFHPFGLFHGQISSHAALVRVETYDVHGPYDPTLKIFGDREFMLRLAAAGCRLRHLEEVVGLYYENPAGLYNADTALGQREFTQLMERFLQPAVFGPLAGLEADPDPGVLADAYVYAGCHGLAVGRLDGASVQNIGTAGRLFAEALQCLATHVPALGNLALVARLNGQPDEAERLFEMAVVEADAEAAAVIRHNRATSGRPDVTPRDFVWLPVKPDAAPVTGLENSQDQAGERYAAMLAAVEDDNPQTVLPVLEDFVAQYPGFATAHNDLGVVRYRLGDKTRALEAYETAVRLAPENTVFQKNLADFYYVEMGRVEAALHIYVRLLAENPRDVEVLLTLARIAADMQQDADAREFYQRVLAVDPSNPEARERLGQLAAATPAAADDTAEAAYRRVQVQIEAGRREAAVTELEWLVADHPDFAPAHNDLGVLLYQLGRKDEVAALYERAVALVPENMVYRKNLADFYFVEAGRTEAALQHYVRVLADDPRDVETLMALGRICELLDRVTDAQGFFRRVLEIAPDHTEASQRLGHLALAAPEALPPKDWS